MRPNRPPLIPADGDRTPALSANSWGIGAPVASACSRLPAESYDLMPGLLRRPAKRDGSLPAG